MLSENRKINALSLVVTGDLNPVIIQPFWLSSRHLIQEEEASNATVEMIHNELVKFQVGDWLNLQVTRERFEVRTTQESYFGPLRDLVLSVFGLLKETPLRALGINITRHYELDEKKYRELGDRLVPIRNWEKVLENPQVLHLEILQKGKKGEPGGQVRIRVQPSDTLRKPYCFMTNINDHYTVTNTQLLSILLNDNWESSFKLADITESNIDQILKA